MWKSRYKLPAVLMAAALLCSTAQASVAWSTKVSQPVCHKADIKRDKDGSIHRSTTAVEHFKKANICPSTGKLGGACPGYVVDHIQALECCGPDDPSNMQWQSYADSKAKDKVEGRCPGVTFK